MNKIIILALLFPLTSLAESNINNPRCQAKLIWHAVSKKLHIPEVSKDVCRNMQLPNGRWVARYDPSADKDYIETDADVNDLPVMDRRYYESINQLLLIYGYTTHPIPNGLK